MRNLGEYPVTDAEILACLRDLRVHLVATSPGVGDIRPMLVDAAIERIETAPRRPGAIGVNKPFARYRRPAPPAARLWGWLTGSRR